MRYSFFQSCTKTAPIMRECSWGEFIEDLALDYVARAANDSTKKFSTPAISPAIYATGATRCDESVLGWGGWMGIDIDNDGWLYTCFDDAVRYMTEIGCDFAIYTTTKATAKCHRLRVLFPLNRELERDEIRPAWDAVCRKLDWLTPDSTCKDLSRIYSVPAIWQARSDGNPNPISLSWCRMDGGALDIDAVLSEAPPTVAPPRVPETAAILLPVSAPVSAPPHRPDRQRKLPSSSIYSSPVVTAAMIEEYVNGPKGSHHTGLYRFMTRVAGRAVAKGYAITEDDLIAFAREVDQMSPIRTNRNRWSRICSEAQRALRFVGAR